MTTLLLTHLSDTVPFAGGSALDVDADPGPLHRLSEVEGLEVVCLPSAFEVLELGHNVVVRVEQGQL